MDLRNEKIKFFRTHIEAGIGPSPKNAIHAEQMKLTACELAMAGETCIGIYVAGMPDKTGMCEQHIIGFANIQTTRLESKHVDEVKKSLESGEVTTKKYKTKSDM